MSIPPPPGPHRPQDPYQPPQPQSPYPQDPFAPPPQDPYAQGPYGPQGPMGAGPAGPGPAGPHSQAPYPQAPYPQAPYGAVPYPVWGQGYSPYGRPSPVNGVAIAALVLGLLCFLPGVGLLLGIIALVQIRKRGERGKAMAVVGTVLSSIGLAVWVLALSTGGASDVWDGFKEGASGNSSFALAKGDCFDVPGETFDEDVYDVDEVACSGEHDAEVFASVPLSGDSYPGDDHVTQVADDKCYTLQDAYAMDPWALTDEVDIYYLTPTADSWSWGDREITCVFANVDEKGTLTGSLRADETTLDAHQFAFLKAMAAVDEVLYEEPEEYAEEDLESNLTWAGDTGDVTGDQAASLDTHIWLPEDEQPVAALVKDMQDAAKEWAAAAKATDADGFYAHYDKAYAYVDGATTVTARKALGLATTPPTYDEDSDSGSGGTGGGDSDSGLDV
ncbi:hypothetical protein J2X68_006103 [Streptomyces sp. 3330]|uniref:DUF4190 domain-containing protein n=1 Tax=Streptomyces sp. 3330 TaxID=2817755 RepID=UPI00285AD316|nr:DUF4190 domain-containing protein [Streptomyces sp. 3330]MDR6979367.1 hypothetical protein [Streptomyces sp. 3330]